MRILQIIRSVDPAGGGPIEAVRQFARYSQESGHSVEIATLDSPQFAKQFETPDVQVHALGPAFFNYGYTSTFPAWLKQNHHHYDCFVINGIWQYHSYASWRVLRSVHRGYVVFPHGMLDPWFRRQYPMKHLKKSLYWALAENRVLRDASGVLFTCEQERFLARESFRPYQALETVVPLGIKDSGVNAQNLHPAFEERFPQLQNKRLVTFVGRIHPKKGCDLLIQAFAKVCKVQHDEWRLLMVGPDQVGWRDELERMAQRLRIDDQVVWLGPQMGEAKWPILAASEVFALPSHQENFGLVVPEALSCSVPVLISNQVNIWREIEGDRAGLVEPDNLAGTVRLLERWIGLSEPDRKRMRGRARDCFVRRFDLQGAGHRLLSSIAAANGNSTSAEQKIAT